ncbi:MAG: accessory gene regulator B family protein [Bacilli bacterium]|nr:accessory gene regulator B family protein [Bacilli bacterium]
MKNLVVNSIMNNITKYYNYDDTKLDEIKYGIESLYLTISKTIIILIGCIILKIVKPLLLLFIFYGIIRLTGFGVHAKKSWHCWVTSLLMFIGIPILISIISVNKNIIFITYLICMILMLKYAPADTEKRPLINKNKRTLYKVLTLLITFIYLILSLMLKNQIIINTLYMSIILETIQILPITYKLYGVRYNNYKNYKKGGKK